MFERIRNAWSLAKSSWRVLQQDRELLWLPVIGGVAALVVVAAFAGLAFATGGMLEAVPAAVYLVLFLGYVAVATVVYLARAAVVHGANLRMEGGDPTVPGSLRGASAHWPAVVGFAAIAATVGLILEALEDQGVVGAILSFIGDAAWRLLTYLVLPVIVLEGCGAVAGIKQSSALVKRTWGEQVTANVGFGLLSVGLMIPSFLVFALAGGIGIGAVAVVLGAVAVAWIVVVAVTVNTLEAIFQTALYRQATGRSIPAEFDAAQLRAVVRPR